MTTSQPTPIPAQTCPSAQLTPSVIQAFVELFEDRIGLRIKPIDYASIFQKIIDRTQATNQPSVADYYQHLVAQTPQSHHEWNYLSEVLTNSESFFFRDRGQFSVLQRHVLPAIIQRNAAAKKLRICSAGCANGEEVYSIVIVLTTLIPNWAQWDIQVCGLDISSKAIAQAEAGIYNEWSLRGLSTTQRQSYFHAVSDRYHIDAKFKQAAKFHHLNLMSDPFDTEAIGESLAQLDLIICRNVFIYFSAEAITKVVSKFYQALKPLGYLLTGHSELYGQNLEQFQIETLPESLIFQKPPLPRLNSKQLSEPTAASFTPAKTAPALPSLPPLSTPPHQHVTADQHLQKAQILLKNKSFEQAIEQVNYALERQSDSPQALCLMAQIHADQSNLSAAIEFCHKAIKADRCFVAPHYILAKAFTRQNDLTSAKRTLKKIIYLEPNAVVAYLELSGLYQQEGNLKRSDFMRHTAFKIFRQHLSISDR